VGEPVISLAARTNSHKACSERALFATSVRIRTRGGNDIGELVWGYEAVEKGTWSSTATAIRIERSTGGFRGGLPGPKWNQITPEDVSQRTRPDRGCPESTVGQSKKRAETSQAWQTNHVGVGASQDRSCSKGEMG